MKKVLFLISALITACAPEKSNKIVRVDVYCDSCEIKITSGYKEGQIWHSVDEYNSIITENKSIIISRYNTPDQCIKIAKFINYAASQAMYVGIESGDTIFKSINTEDGFCH